MPVAVYRLLRALLHWFSTSTKKIDPLHTRPTPNRRGKRQKTEKQIQKNEQRSAQTHVNKEEWRLIKKAQKGSQHACKQLIKKYGPALRGYLAYTCRFGFAEADDLLQETWLQIWRSLQSFRGDASFRTWSMTICRRVAAAAIRKRVQHPQTASIDEMQEPTDTKEDIESMLHLKEKSVRIRELFSSIHDKGREVLDLFYLQELSPSEISTLLEIPEGTVKSRLADARRQLRRAWQRKYGNAQEGKH